MISPAFAQEIQAKIEYFSGCVRVVKKKLEGWRTGWREEERNLGRKKKEGGGGAEG